MSIAFVLTDTETSANFHELLASQFVTVGGVTYLVTSPAGGEAVEVFQVGVGGVLTPVVQDNVVSGALTRQFAAVEAGGQTYLYWSAGNGLRSGLLDGSGQLTEVQTLYQVDHLGDLLTTVRTVTAANVGGADFLVVGTGEGLGVYAVASDGTLSNVFDLADDGDLALTGVYQTRIVAVGGATYVVAASYDESGLSVLRLEADGSLTETDTLFDSGAIGLAAPGALTSAVVGGVTYIIAGGAEYGLTVMALAADGTLGPATTQQEGGAASYSALTTYHENGRVFILAANPDNGLHAFELDPGGILSAPGLLLDDGSGVLLKSSSLDLATIGGVDYLAASSFSGQAVSLVSLTHVGFAYDDSFSLSEGQGVSGDLLASNGQAADRLSPGDQIAAVNGQAGAVGNQITLASGALLTINADGTFVYDQNGVHDDLVDPASGAANVQRTETVTYSLTSGATATLSIVVSGLDGAHDVLLGTVGQNTIHAGTGNDTVYGFAGTDGLYGEDGGDGLYGGIGFDTLSGGAGADKLFGEGDEDTLTGDDGADRLFGGDASDTLHGASGPGSLETSNDYLDGGAGADHMSGSGGNDVYIVDDLADVTIEFDAEGYDIVRTELDGWVLSFSIEALQLQGSADLDGTGNEAANNIQGNSGANRLDGGEGVDTLNGNDGDDIVIGGLGNDLLRGGTGADTFLVAHVFGPALETDQVYDFSAAEGDILDLSAAFAGTLSLVSTFSKQAGQMTLTFAGGVTTLRLDTTGDGRVDYQVKINGDVTGESGDWLL